MGRTLLELIDQASGEMGLSQPTAVIGNTNNQTVQLKALAQRLGLDLVREYEWYQLVRAYTFTTVAAVSTTGAVTAGSAVITAIPDTSSLVATNVVSGNGIALSSQVVSVDSPTQVTLDLPATASGTVTLSFAYQFYSLPNGFDRMVSEGFWDRTNHWLNIGAISSQTYGRLQGGAISVGPRLRYRLNGHRLQWFPAPTAAINETFPYISGYWVKGAADNDGSKAVFTLDNDTCIFPDDLMLAGLKYYFRRAKGLDFGVDLADFDDVLSTRKAQDQPLQNLSLSPNPVPEFIGPWSVPEGGWNI